MLYDFREWVGGMPGINPVHSPISVWLMDAFFLQFSPHPTQLNITLH